MTSKRRTALSTRGIALFAMTLTLGAGVGRTHAASGTKAFDRAMMKIFGPYEVIAKALAADRTQGVTPAAKRIIRATPGLKAQHVKGKHAAHYAKLSGALKRAAKALAKAKNISDARVAFKALSQPMAMWATMSKPPGINVFYCSMAKGSWLQTSKTVANPYYGAKMSSCGELVGR